MVTTCGVNVLPIQKNKDNKELDKFRPKKQKKNADKKETHNVEFAEGPLQDVITLKLLKLI